MFKETPDVRQLRKNDIKLAFGPLTVDDLSDKYVSSGLHFVQGVPQELHPLQPISDLTNEVPKPVQIELSVLGDPARYPFDRYLIMGRVSCNAFTGTSGTKFRRLEGDHYSADLRIPGFKLRNATGKELEDRDDMTHALVQALNSKQASNPEELRSQTNYLTDLTRGYSSEFWRERQFAFILERPFFLKFFACFLAVIALSSLVYVALRQDLKSIVMNSGGFFLGLWGLRQVLSTNAPKTATLIDYATIVLYSLLVTIVVTRILLWRLKVTPQAGSPESR